MGKRIYTVLITIMIILFALNHPEEALASLNGIHPDVACGFLADIGMTTRGWQHIYDDLFECKSQSIQFGSPRPLKNDLFYYVQGTSATVEELGLVLSVNNVDECSEANNLFLQVTQELLTNVTNEPMPENMVDAILNGKNYSFINDNINVTVKISYWIMKSKKLNSVIAKGYELRFVIK